MAKEILLYGTIGADFWTGGGITASWFLAALKEAEASGEDIVIRINTPGGDIGEGIAIYNAIANSTANIITINDGIAYSMGAFILLAGKTVKAHKNTTILIHNCRGLAWGTAKDMEATAEMMNAIDAGMAESLAEKTGLSVNEVLAKWLDHRDHTLTAREALTEKLIDEVIEKKSDGVPSGLANMSQQQLFAHYAGMSGSQKKGFIAELKSEILASIKNLNPFPGSQHTSNDNNNTHDDMKLTITNGQVHLAAALNITFGEGETSKEVEISTEQGEAINAKLAELAQAATDAKTEKEAAEANLTAANAEVTKLKGIAAKQTSPAKTKETIDEPVAKTQLDELHDQAVKGTVF